MKQTSLTFLTWKMIPGGGGKGRGGDGTVALWHCGTVTIRVQPNYRQYGIL